ASALSTNGPPLTAWCSRSSGSTSRCCACFPISVAGKGKGPIAASGEDPYEINWPDDAKEMRAAERERAAQRASTRPAPRYLTAIVLGLSIVLGFIAPVAFVIGAPGILIGFAAPVVFAGLIVAFPAAALLERVSRRWRTGLPELAFLVLGIAIGYGWTHFLISLAPSDLFESAAEFEFVRSI